MPNSNVAFPSATVANPNYDAPEFKLENPYEIKNSTWNGEEWQKEKKERKQELKELQSQNGAGNERIAKSDFPTTFADLSFTDQNAIKSAGYEPYKDSSAYKTFKIESEDEYRTRMNNRQQNNMASYNNNNGQNPTIDGSDGNGSLPPSMVDDGIIHLYLG